MAYDLQTPFGTTPGMLTQQEQLQAQIAASLRNSLGGRSSSGGGQERSAPAPAPGGKSGPFAGDSFFDEAPTPGAGYADEHNRMVDMRQQGQRLMDTAAANSSGIPESGSRADRGDWRGLMDAQISGASAQEVLKNKLRDQFGNMLGAPSGSPAMGPPNPDPSQDTRPMGGGTSDNDLLRMSLFAGVLNPGQGGGGGGIGALGTYLNGRDSSRAQAQQAQIQSQLLQAQLDELKRQHEREHAKEDLGSGTVAAGAAPPEALDQFLPKSGLAGNLEGLAENFGKRDTAMFGFDPSEQDILDIMKERNALVQSLRQRGYDAKMAKDAANRQILMKLQPYQHDLNSGWVQTLRDRL